MVDSSPISRFLPLRALTLNQGPFARPALPGFAATTGLSATPNGPVCSSRSPGCRSHASTAGASRVACRFLFHACRRHYPGGFGRMLLLVPSNRRRPSPLLRRVGSHIARFEACSTFNHITACILADFPRKPFLEVLQSISLPPRTAPSTTGRSNKLPGGIRTHWK